MSYTASVITVSDLGSYVTTRNPAYQNTLGVDIDRPTRGGIRESQLPMQWTLQTLKTTPPATYDRWLTPEPPATVR